MEPGIRPSLPLMAITIWTNGLPGVRRVERGTEQDEDLAPIHNARLDAVCQSIKNKNVTIWTLSFTLPLNQHTRGCATGNERAMQANDRDKLIQNFRTIATSIAELRLVD